MATEIRAEQQPYETFRALVLLSLTNNTVLLEFALGTITAGRVVTPFTPAKTITLPQHR